MIDLRDYNDPVGIETLSCCGCGEISGIQEDVQKYTGESDWGSRRTEHVQMTPELIVLCVKGGVDYRYPHLLFTAAKLPKEPSKWKIGDELTRYIRKYDLGTVRASGWKMNPNSHNPVKAFMWEVNWKNMNSFTGTPPAKAVRKGNTAPKGASKKRVKA